MNFLFVIFTLYVVISHITYTTAQILRGLEVNNTGFEYQAIIITDHELCGGAIIDEWHVLTSAHCFDLDSSLDVLLLAGMIILEDKTKIKRIVRNIHIHPNYTKGIFDATHHRPQRRGNDIAVLKLDRAMELGGSIKKIDLPTVNIHYCNICFFSGWGTTEVGGTEPSPVLQWSSLIIIPPNFCESLGISLEADEFCARDPAEESTPLQGDSGSPMRCDDELTGIVSISSEDPRRPTIFINVYKHLDFINEMMSN